MQELFTQGDKPTTSKHIQKDLEISKRFIIECLGLSYALLPSMATLHAMLTPCVSFL